MTRAVGTVAVIGCDAACWLTALALQRSFSRTGVKVEVVELPTQLAPSDVFATLPTAQGLHRLLGIEESLLLKHSKAVFSFGQRFAGWGRSAPPFLHAYDAYGVSIQGVPFLQYWLKARQAGLDVPLEDFSLGAVAAKQNRVALLSEEAGRFSRATHGYHLDAFYYLSLVREMAVRSGVEVSRGLVKTVEWTNDRIETVTLHDGRVVTADLFVDATGPEALLMREAPMDDFRSWSDLFPCDRIMSVSAQRLRPRPAFSQILAFRAGWIGAYPLQDRTALSVAFGSSEGADDEILQSVPVLTGMKVESDVTVASIAQGARRKPWVGNCVAVGEAAVTLEPLDAVTLHLVQTGISHLVTRFPVDADDMREATRYNEIVFDHACRIRDFQLAHYKLNRRWDEPLWDRARDAEVPDTLAYKIETFGACGHVPMYDDEAFLSDDWTASFIGHGLVPDTYDPLVDALPEDEQIHRFKQLLAAIGAEVREMPSLEAHLELHAPSTSPASF